MTVTAFSLLIWRGRPATARLGMSSQSSGETPAILAFSIYVSRFLIFAGAIAGIHNGLTYKLLPFNSAIKIRSFFNGTIKFTAR